MGEANPDLILTMTAGHKEQVEERFAPSRGKLFTLSEFARYPGEIADPFEDSLEVYRECARQMLARLNAAVDRLRCDHRSG